MLPIIGANSGWVSGVYRLNNNGLIPNEAGPFWYKGVVCAVAGLLFASNAQPAAFRRARAAIGSNLYCWSRGIE